jgi:thiamine-monophosphate kinase
MTKTLKEVGEFGLIRRIRRLLKAEGVAEPADLTVGIGDDTAAFKPRPGYEILVTCDSVVEGRHYLPQIMGPRDVGRRSMVINISDIGAMGGRPRYALVSLGLKGETDVEEVEEMYRGFLDELNPFGAAVIGGNLTKSGSSVFIDITLIGEAKEGKVLRRSTARPGDIVLVTGYPGRSAAGLQLLIRSLASMEHPLIMAYIKPLHRATAGVAVAGTGYASAMIDTSDGFLGDLGHICEESGVGVELFQERFPVSKDLQEAGTLLGKDPHDFFLGTSDDYELIITCAADRVNALRSALAGNYEGPLTEVGTLTAQAHRVCLVMRDGSRKALTPKGWNHFR